jgi:hypothetical protein
MFNDKAYNRHLSILFKISKGEKDFLIQEASKRGISIVALLRKCVRDKLVPRAPRKKGTDVESST